jgi:hypothetical protein
VNYDVLRNTRREPSLPVLSSTIWQPNFTEKVGRCLTMRWDRLREYAAIHMEFHPSDVAI